MKPLSPCFRTIIFLLCLCAQSLHAQEFRTLLRQLGDKQKAELLQYVLKSGYSIDRLLINLYDQSDAGRKTKMQAYAQFLQNDPEDMPRTRVRWSADTLLLGKIEEGYVVIDSFTVRNEGPLPYHIREVRSNCDCTVLRYPEYPILPGEQATIRVEFNSVGKAGVSTPGIILYDNSTPNSRTILYLRAEIIRRNRRTF